MPWLMSREHETLCLRGTRVFIIKAVDRNWDSDEVRRGIKQWQRDEIIAQPQNVSRTLFMKADFTQRAEFVVIF